MPRGYCNRDVGVLHSQPSCWNSLWKIRAHGSGGISDIEYRADRLIYWCPAVDNKKH